MWSHHHLHHYYYHRNYSASGRQTSIVTHHLDCPNRLRVPWYHSALMIWRGSSSDPSDASKCRKSRAFSLAGLVHRDRNYCASYRPIDDHWEYSHSIDCDFARQYQPVHPAKRRQKKKYEPVSWEFKWSIPCRRHEQRRSLNQWMNIACSAKNMWQDLKQYDQGGCDEHEKIEKKNWQDIAVFYIFWKLKLSSIWQISLI